MAIRKKMLNKRPRLNLLPPIYVEFCVSLLPPVCEICKLTWIWLKMSTYSYTFKILHRNKGTVWTNKYMDVISKDEPFRCEFQFFLTIREKVDIFLSS